VSVFWAHTPTKKYSSLVFPHKELLSPACGFIIIILLTSKLHEEEEEHYVFDARDDDDDDDDDGGDIEGRFSLRERLQVERDDDDDDEEDYSSF
jgi:hypothetical protein